MIVLVSAKTNRLYNMMHLPQHFYEGKRTRVAEQQQQQQQHEKEEEEASKVSIC